MMETTWTDADAKLLRELRVATGVDRATFARRCTLSTAQLAELEDGGNGRFYSERIKSHTGHTLLAKLGHVRPAQAPAPALETAPLFAAEPSINPRAQARQEAQAAVSDVIGRPVGEPEPASSRGKTWMGALVVGCAVIGLLAWLNRPQAPAAIAAAEVPVAAAEPVSEVASPSASAPATGTESAASAATAASAPTAVASANLQAAPTRELRCDAPTGAPLQFTPAKALKPGNYVYIEASRPTPVCVTDAKQQQQRVMVKPGEGETLTGTPPFTVQAAAWAPLRVFFQGVRVPLEELGSSTGALQLHTP